MNRRPGPTSLALTVVGAGVLVWWTVLREYGHQPTWALALFTVALLCWVGRTVLAWLARWRSGTVLAAAAVLVGAVAAPATQGNALIPVAVCLLVLVGDPELPLAFGIAAGIAAMALIALGALIDPLPAAALATMLGVPVIAVLAGFSRRQGRQAQLREALLAEREVAIREEAIRVALARDLHDVLAHTLGGLVVQLDAAEALLEAGQPEAAEERVRGARSLAASGLGEARRAVAALRSPADALEPWPPERFEIAVDDLLDAHRSLGGTVELNRSGSPVTLSGVQANALQRALQEALSNARRHAPGAPVTAVLTWHDDRVLLSVRNPLPSVRPAGASGGGYGLIGMRERFEALPGGGSVTVQDSDGWFTVRAEAGLR